MRRLMRWATRRGDWEASDFLGLPTVDPMDSPALQRWQVVAGGLALVLSRLTPMQRDASFAASQRMYRSLRHRLRQRADIAPPPELLSDVMHEIAGIADPTTTQCLRACFDASLAREAVHGRQARLQGESRSTSRMQSQPRPEWRDTQREAA